MTFIAGAVVWAAYTAIWWGWEAVTNRVPPGPPGQFHWPSIKDLVSPGRMAVAIPPQMGTTPSSGGPVTPNSNPAPGAATTDSTGRRFPTVPSL